MILKCKNAGGNDVLFDGFDEIHHEYTKKDAVIGVRADCLDFLKMEEKIEENMPAITGGRGMRVASDFVQVWLHKNGDVLKQILAHSPIYIMNDEGKTVEKI
jgi:hypothetical protein